MADDGGRLQGPRCRMSEGVIPKAPLCPIRVHASLELVHVDFTMFGIQKCQTTAYHPQCNGQVEAFHQMLFRMIGKLASDKKVQ